MADSFSGMDCRLRKSMKDSIMMNSLFLAMNKAHEKLKSRQGVIGRLIEISKFYELAVMQLDGCLKIVEEETDSLSLEVNHEETLSDLYIIRDRLQRRLDDTELTIMNTDSCLTERFEIELKLREALEMKEKELVSLRGDLDQLERTKSEGHQAKQKTVRNQVAGVDDGKEGDISQLKNSVDMKFCSFKQMFEERKFSVENSQIDQLSSDIDRLKESLDLAFGKMQNAIFLSAVEPAEHEWRWSIEKDVMLLSAKGLTDDFHDIHEPTVWKLNYFSLLMNEIRSLRSEFEQLMREKEAVISPSPTLNDFRVKILSGAKERPPLDDKRGKSDERTKVEQADLMEEEGGNYVAKLISTHERIIQKKVEEQRAKERLIRERWYSAMRKDKQHDGLNKKIQDVIARLDSIINLNPPPSQISEDPHENIVKPGLLRRFSSESEIEIRNISSSSMFFQVDDDIIGQVRILEREKEESRIQFLVSEEVHTIILRDWIKQCYDDFDMKIEQLFIKVGMLEQETENLVAKSFLVEEVCRNFEKENEELYRKVKILELTNKDSEGQSTILEDLYAVLLRSLTTENHNEMEKIRASNALLEEIVDTFTEDTIATNIEFQTSTTILIEKIKDTKNSEFSISAEMQEIFMNGLCGKFPCKTYASLFQGLLLELSKYVENSNAENLINQESYRLVFEETIRDIVDTHTFKSSRFPEEGNSNELSTIGCSVEENGEPSASQEMAKEWNMSQTTELMIREDIYQFVLLEAAKDAYILSEPSEDSLPDNYSMSSLGNGQESYIQRLDYMLRCLESEQGSIPSVIPEIMDRNSGIDQNGTQHPWPQGTDGEGNIEELLVDDEIDFTSVRHKFENALHQLCASRKLITELRFDFGINSDQAAPDAHTVLYEDGDVSLVNVHILEKNKRLITDYSSTGIDIDQASTGLDSISDNEDSANLLKDQDCGSNLSQSIVPSMFSAVSEVLHEFEQTAHLKLDSNSLRLEATRHRLSSLLDHAGSLRKNETLYKNAFMRRCHDLHLAETEVDLLGDQVDSLLTLLEKIHWTLYRHSLSLRQHFEVQDLLNLIKKEINCGSIINSSTAS
ncbi:hypothetical protein QQ045_024493 [Rhodiola kirilowii]